MGHVGELLFFWLALAFEQNALDHFAASRATIRLLIEEAVIPNGFTSIDSFINLGGSEGQDRACSNFLARSQEAL